jgi:site-specific recombinase XerD
MTLLRKKFIDQMVLRNFAPGTQTAYVNAVANLARFYKLSPDKINNDQIQAYLVHLLEQKKLSWSMANIVFSAFRLFYQQVLGRNAQTFYLPPRKQPKKHPTIFSVGEVCRLLSVVTNQKHRTLLWTIYLAGLRVSEVVGLAVEDINSERMIIRIRQGKGHKDRDVVLSKELLHELRDYWKRYRPTLWLFPARGSQQPLRTNAVRNIFKRAKQKAGLTKKGGPHTLRHCYATHLLEGGVDIHSVKELLGHASLKSTTRYLHLTQKNREQVLRALQAMSQPLSP